MTNEPVNTDEVKKAEDKWYPGKGVEAVGGAIADNPGGAVAGGIVGTILLPGVGTAIGIGVGAWWAKKRKERRDRELAIIAGKDADV